MVQEHAAHRVGPRLRSPATLDIELVSERSMLPTCFFEARKSLGSHHNDPVSK